MDIIKRVNQVLLFIVLSSLVGGAVWAINYQVTIYSKCGGSKQINISSCELEQFRLSIGLTPTPNNNSCWCAARM